MDIIQGYIVICVLFGTPISANSISQRIDCEIRVAPISITTEQMRLFRDTVIDPHDDLIVLATGAGISCPIVCSCHRITECVWKWEQKWEHLDCRAVELTGRNDAAGIGYARIETGLIWIRDR